MGSPFPVSLPAESRKATASLRAFTSPRRVDRAVPRAVLAHAQGFAIFSVFRIGFLMSARAGAGVVVARLPDGSGWSPPTAIGLGGLGGGFNCGAEVTDFLVVLTSRRAIATFMATGSLQLGGNMALALGPLGRAAEAGGSLASNGRLAALLSYSRSRGLYGGISLEGTVLLDRADANAKAYGPGVTSRDILIGRIDPPDFALALIESLNRATGRGAAVEPTAPFRSGGPYVLDADHDRSAAARNGYSYDRASYDSSDNDSTSSDDGDTVDSLRASQWPARRGTAAGMPDTPHSSASARWGHKRSMSLWDTPPARSSPSYHDSMRAAYGTRAGGRSSGYGATRSRQGGAAPFTSGAHDERARLDDMDALDRELQQGPTSERVGESWPTPAGTTRPSRECGWPAMRRRHARSQTYDPAASSALFPAAQRAHSPLMSSAFLPARTGGGSGAPSKSLNPYAAMSGDWDDDTFFGTDRGLGPRRITPHRSGAGPAAPCAIGDYESQLAPARTDGNSHPPLQSHELQPQPQPQSQSQSQSQSPWSTRPTSPIGMESVGGHTSSRAHAHAHAHTDRTDGGLVELPLSETRLVMASYEFTPASPTDLRFARGDVIRVTTCSSTREDWWSGECHGVVGWFPANRTIDL